MSRLKSSYYAVLFNQSMSIVARFDSWISLSYTNIVNNVGSFEISLSGDDPRKDLFELDAVLRIYRSIPGLVVEGDEMQSLTDSVVHRRRLSRLT